MNILKILNIKFREEDTVLETRTRLLYIVLFLINVLGIPALIIGAIEAYFLQQYSTVIVYILFFVPIIILTIFRKQLKYKWIVYVFISATFLLATSNIITYGFSGAGIPIFFGLFALTTLFIDQKAGLLMVLMSAISISIIGYLYITHKILLDIALNEISIKLISWITALSVLVLLGSLIVFSYGIIHTKMLQSIELERENAKKLEEANTKLKKDIQKRIKTEQELKESETRFSSIIEQTVDAMFISDFHGNIHTINRKACEKLGYTREELVKMNISEIDVNPISKIEFKEQWKDLVAGEVHTIETRHKRKNGRTFPVEVSIGLYNYSNKKSILGFARDITDRKQAEELLRKSENSVRAKLNAILLPEGNLEVLSLEEVLDIQAISKIMENIFKLTGVSVALGDLEGKALAAFGWQDICTQYHRANSESCKNCTESDTILASKVEPGKYQLYKCKNNLWDLSTPIHVGNRHVGNIFIGQFFFKDETPELTLFKKQAELYGFNETEYLLALERVPRLSRETVNALAVFYAQFSTMISNLSYSSIRFAKIAHKQKQSEDEIKQLNEELESKVMIRTAELEKKSKDLIDSQNALLNIVEDLNEKSEQLQEKTTALEAVNKELESFSYSVSHDLRAPLRGIDGFSQALLEDYSEILDEQGKNYLSRVRNGTQKMALLIDEMLNLSRLGRVIMKPIDVKLSEMVQSISEDLQGSEPHRSAQFVIKPDIVCTADQTLISVVLQNLLENAWKFTSKKEKTVIEFSQIANEGKVTYFVRDNGAGFNMDYANKLFTPFQRLHNISEFPGTGIGLTTVQRIIHRHKGELWAEGEVDKGAVFYFTLKL